MTSDAMVMDVTEDWVTACNVQQRSMQHTDLTIATLRYSARCRQVHALGGDCYAFVPLPHNRLALAIGDASGKGLGAALMISNVQSSLRTAASLTGNDLPAMLSAVNRQVHASSLADRYATLFYGVFDDSKGTLQYVNAGHNPPMVLRQDGATIWLETGGVPIGVFPNSTYHQGTVPFNPGDMLIAYTDGVIEAVSPSGEEWGIERLRRAAVENKAQDAKEIVDAIFASLDEFSRGRQTDDMTILVLLARY